MGTWGLVPNQHPISFLWFRPETNTETKNCQVDTETKQNQNIQVLQHFLNKDTVPKSTNVQIH